MLNQDRLCVGTNTLLVKQQASPVLISDVMECMGLTRHHWNVIYVVFSCWAIAGWLGTAIAYVLDGASEADSDWVQITSLKDRLTVQDRSWALLVCGFVALSGNALMGYCSDKFGRIFTTTLCLAPVPLITIGIAHAWSKIVLFSFLFCMPWFKDGPCSVTNCLLAEWLPIAYRGYFLVLVHMLWNVGRVGVTMLWIAVPPEDDWRSFCYCVAIFPTMLLVFLFLQGHKFESARWLFISGNKERCIECLKLAATDGSLTLPDGWDNSDLLADAGGNTKCDDELSMAELLSRIAGPSLRLDLAALSLWFFSISYCANGMMFWLIEYLKQTGREDAVQPAMLAAPVGKITGALLLVLGGPRNCAVDTYDRRPLITCFFAGFAVTLAILSATTSTAAITLATFVSQVCEEIIWCAIFLYATEAFPTVLRSTAFGILSAFANLGGIISASCTMVLMDINQEAPIYSMVVLLLLASASTLLVEEGGRGKKTLTDRVDHKGYGLAADSVKNKQVDIA